jgi:hypothetical protein
MVSKMLVPCIDNMLPFYFVQLMQIYSVFFFHEWLTEATLFQFEWHSGITFNFNGHISLNLYIYIYNEG